jgi:hypothetical protein
MEMEKITRWAFIAFVVIAAVMGLVVGYMAWNANNTYPIGWSDTNVSNTNGYVTLILLILGILVGLVNITAKEVNMFLIATVALIVASISKVWTPLDTIHPLLAYWADGILNYIVAFVAPAAVILAIKAVFAMEKSKAA